MLCTFSCWQSCAEDGGMGLTGHGFGHPRSYQILDLVPVSPWASSAMIWFKNKNFICQHRTNDHPLQRFCPKNRN